MSNDRRSEDGRTSDQDDLAGIVASCQEILAKLSMLSEVPAHRLTHECKQAQMHAPDFPAGVDGSAAPGPERAPSKSLSLYWHYRWRMERAVGEARDQAEASPRRKAAIARLKRLAIYAEKDYRIAKGDPVVRNYATEDGAVRALLTDWVGCEAEEAAVEFQANMTLGAATQWVKQRRKEAGHDPEDGVARRPERGEGMALVRELALSGLGPRAIARETCIPKTTVENWLKSKEPAEV